MIVQFPWQYTRKCVQHGLFNNLKLVCIKSLISQFLKIAKTNLNFTKKKNLNFWINIVIL